MMIQRMTLAAQSPLLPRRASNLFPTDHAPGLNKVHPGVEKKNLIIGYKISYGTIFDYIRT